MKFYAFVLFFLFVLLINYSQSKPLSRKDEDIYLDSSSTLENKTFNRDSEKLADTEKIILSRGKKKRLRKRNNVYKETSPDEILKMLTSKDLSRKERNKLAHFAKLLSGEMGPHPKASFQRFKFHGRKMKVKLTRSETQKNIFERKVNSIVGSFLRFLSKVPVLGKIVKTLGYKDESTNDQSIEQEKVSFNSVPGLKRTTQDTNFSSKKEDTSSFSVSKSGKEVPNFFSPKRVSVPIGTPGISQIILGDKMQKAKKAFMYVHADDQKRNDDIVNLVEKAYDASGTKIPLIKINRKPEDIAIRSLFGECDAILSALQLRIGYSNVVDAVGLADDEENWTLETLTKFFQEYSEKPVMTEPYLSPTRKISAPLTEPGLNKLCFGGELRAIKKAFIYVHAEDATHNEQILKLVSEAYDKSGTKVPLIKVNRHPEDTAVRQIYGEKDAGLGMFEYESQTEVNVINLGNEVKFWKPKMLKEYFEIFSQHSVLDYDDCMYSTLGEV